MWTGWVARISATSFSATVSTPPIKRSLWICSSEGSAGNGTSTSTVPCMISCRSRRLEARPGLVACILREAQPVLLAVGNVTEAVDGDVRVFERDALRSISVPDDLVLFGQQRRTPNPARRQHPVAVPCRRAEHRLGMASDVARGYQEICLGTLPSLEDPLRRSRPELDRHAWLESADSSTPTKG